MSYTWDAGLSSLRILEENHYYPYGLKHGKYNIESYTFVTNGGYYSGNTTKTAARSLYQYKFNGKEYQDELGLNMTAMDMRQYDPAIARWVVQDPVIHHNMSPYNAFDNNPVVFADPSGAEATFSFDMDEYMNRERGSGRMSTSRTESPGGSGVGGSWSILPNGNYSTSNVGDIANLLAFIGGTFTGSQATTVSEFIAEEMQASKDANIEGVTVHGRNGRYSEGAINFAVAKVTRNINAYINYNNSFGGLFGVVNFNDLSSFNRGFLGASASNMMEGSAWTDYASLHLEKTAALIKFVNPTSTLLKTTKSLGSKLGYLGIALTIYEDINENKLGIGTGVKTIIGISTVICPAFGVAYAIIDLTVGFATGTTLTDRIADGIENSYYQK